MSCALLATPHGAGARQAVPKPTGLPPSLEAGGRFPISGLGGAGGSPAPARAANLPLILASSSTPPAQGFVEIAPDFVLDEWERVDRSDSPPFLPGPSAVAIDDEGDLYVLDTQNHRVAVFDEGGVFRRSFGRRGEGPGEFSFLKNYLASGIAVAGGRVAVLEGNQRRVSLFLSDGTFVGAYSYAGSIATDIALGDDYAYLAVIAASSDSPQYWRISTSDLTAESHGAPALRGAGAALPATVNVAVIAAGPDDQLLFALRYWPVLRRFENDRLAEEVILPPSFFPATWVPRLQEVYAALEQARQGAVAGPEPPPQSLLFDVEYIPGTDRWAVLINAVWVRIIESDGTVVAGYRLQAEDDAFAPLNIALDPGGTRLCAADPTVTSTVACYSLR